MQEIRTYSPLAFGEVLPDLGADRLVDVFAEGCVTSDPETKAKMLLQKGFAAAGWRGVWALTPSPMLLWRSHVLSPSPGLLRGWPAPPRLWLECSQSTTTVLRAPTHLLSAPLQAWAAPSWQTALAGSPLALCHLHSCSFRAHKDHTA